MKVMIIAAAVGALALAACGAEEGASGAATEAERRDAATKFARCMREQGVDMPDPQVGEDGGLVIKGPGAPGVAGEVSGEKLRKADGACRKHLAAIEPPKLSEREQAEFKERALAHSRCMRENGVKDFPDPQIGEDGRTEMKLGGPDGGGVDPTSPAFRKALETCDKGGRGGLIRPAPAGAHP